MGGRSGRAAEGKFHRRSEVVVECLPYLVENLGILPMMGSRTLNLALVGPDDALKIIHQF